WSRISGVLMPQILIVRAVMGAGMGFATLRDSGWRRQTPSSELSLRESPPSPTGGEGEFGAHQLLRTPPLAGEGKAEGYGRNRQMSIGWRRYPRPSSSAAAMAGSAAAADWRR